MKNEPLKKERKLLKKGYVLNEKKEELSKR